MASFFRAGSATTRSKPAASPRPTLAGSSTSMLGVSSDTVISRRASRTDLDFERALLSSETVHLHEGMDMSSLGGPESQSPLPRRTSRGTPATPTVQPPTPRANGGQHQQDSSLPLPAGYGVDDVDLQTKRRSIFRSPGTASSPDLATLVRRAKAASAAAESVDESTEDSEGLLFPPSSDSASRQRTPSTVSSTYSLVAPPSPPPKARDLAQDLFPQTPKGSRDQSAPSTPEWDMASPRQRTLSKDGMKSMKATVRSKTSSFLGRMLGQGSVRDKPRSNTISGGSPAPPSSYNAPPLPQLFSTPSRTSNAPPVPPLPSHYRSASKNASAASSSQDIFSAAESPHGSTKALALNQERSRPSAAQSDKSDISSPAESPLLRTRPPEVIRRISERENRRRSRSLGGVEWKHIVAAGTAGDNVAGRDRPSNDWEHSMKSFMGDFSLAELETAGNSSKMNSPISPTPVESGHTPLGDVIPSPYRSSFNGSPSPSLPSVVLTESISFDLASDEAAGRTENFSPDSPASASVANSGDSPTSDSATISPRSSSVRLPSSRSSTPQHSSIASGSAKAQQPRSTRPASATVLANYSSANHPSLVFGSQSNSPDSHRLRVQHRSVASTSEPSLINPQKASALPSPISGTMRLPEGARTVRLLPSTPPRAAAHALARRASDTEDVETKGKELGTRCWNEDETFLPREKIAEFLGGTSALSKKALQHYIDFYEFSNLRLDHAFRRLCAKLFLRGETQQVDRILAEFSRRFYDCNPATVFGNASVVHQIAYSLLLLNTDLHVAELSSHMSRTQFIRNTMSAVMPERKQTLLEMEAPPQATHPDTPPEQSSSSRTPTGDGDQAAGHVPRSKRSGSIQSWKSSSRDQIIPGAPLVSTPTSVVNPSDSSSSLPNGATEQTPMPTSSSDPASNQTPWAAGKSWEMEVETVLKEMYNAIKSQQILQPVINGSQPSLSPGAPYNTVMRNRSQRGQADRLNTMKRGSIRGIHTLLGAQGPHGASPYSSNSSLDGRISPSPSFTTSMNDVASSSSSAFFAPTIGFASNLSRTIIREAQEDDSHSIDSRDTDESSVSITDEELALHGAPWAKEGMLTRKQYWEATGRRARNKNWINVFAVISKGDMKMFTFGEGHGGGANVVGGGNWLTTAQSMGDVSLSHSLAHHLPPPGYSAKRPHCFVLTLASGAVYFFQAGTEDLVNEWVQTCNYWAARQSKEPLAGGVSNMEYGWNRVSEEGRFSMSPSAEDLHDSRTGDHTDTFSVRSGRSRMSKRSFADAASTLRRNQSPRDRIIINEWKPPIPSTVPSAHDEETQLEAMQRQVIAVDNEIDAHKALQAAMLSLYTPRSANYNKAQANWERKSQYLLTELVKYKTYAESLRTAMAMRLKKRGEKALERALGSVSTDSMLAMGKPLPEDPTTPVVGHHRHRREVAEDDEDD